MTDSSDFNVHNCGGVKSPNDPSSPTPDQSQSFATEDAKPAFGAAPLLGVHTIQTKIIIDKSVKQVANILYKLSISKFVPNRVLRALHRLLFDSLEINNINCPTVRTGMVLRCSVNKQYLKGFKTLGTAYRFFNGKIPLHERISV